MIDLVIWSAFVFMYLLFNVLVTVAMFIDRDDKPQFFEILIMLFFGLPVLVILVIVLIITSVKGDGRHDR